MNSFKDDLHDLQVLTCRKLLEEIRKERPGGEDIPPALLGQAIRFLELNRIEGLSDQSLRGFFAAQASLF